MIPIEDGNTNIIGSEARNPNNLFGTGIGSHFENLKFIRFVRDTCPFSEQLFLSLGQYISQIKNDFERRGICIESLIETGDKPNHHTTSPFFEAMVR